MPKRKHIDFEEDSLSEFEHREDRKGNLQATRLRHKFERGSQLLYRALKTARGFERQKLGRRQKFAQQNDDEQTFQRLEAEVQALKNLDLSTAAEKHLFKRLEKTKRIAESPAFARLKSSMSIPIYEPRDAAEVNVTARLLKSNPVKNAMPGIICGIREILGLDDIKMKSTEQSTGKPAGVVDLDGSATLEKNGGRLEAHKKDGISGDISMDDVEQIVDLAHLDRLVSSPRASDSGAEDGSAMQETVSPQQARYDLTADMSLSPSPSSASESPPLKAKSGGLAADSKARPTTNTFLPSLMMGGYWSGSESEADEDAAEAQPRRKNRMGQQARRALWEKKYGNKANHLRNNPRPKDKESRDRGWDLCKGAIIEDHDPKGHYKGRGSTAQPFREPGHSTQCGMNTRVENIIQRRKTNEGKPSSLHPSWEAARRAKEQKAQASFCGKKIVFDL